LDGCNRRAEKWQNDISSRLFVAALIIAAVGFEASRASAQTRIDLTYDSMMDMVRPEHHPGIAVHHNLQIVFSGQNVAENRDRNARQFSDRNAMVQELGGTDRQGTYASWRVESNTRLVRTQRDPQSTRIMTVTLTSPTTCHLDVVDTLNPGFSEYAFLRISTHTLGYFSSYRVIQTSCSIR
jgi:hypothetical protein